MDLIPCKTSRTQLDEDDGLTQVNELLDWNQELPLMPVLNAPKLFVCEDAQQAIWMFQNFTGKGGSKGACKDFADLARYTALAKLEYLDNAKAGGRPGGGF